MGRMAICAQQRLLAGHTGGMTTSPVTTDIVAFITARLDERQQFAEAAAKDASPRFDVDGTHWRSADGEYVSCEEATLAVGPYGFLGDAIANHVVANDPAFVLADVAAKRVIIEDYHIVLANYVTERQQGDEVMAGAYELVAKSLLMVLRRLVTPYADHPDYRDEWKVSADV